MLLVTHDVEEAVYLAGRVLVPGQTGPDWVAAPLADDAEYYPVLVAVVKVAVALMLLTDARRPARSGANGDDRRVAERVAVATERGKRLDEAHQRVAEVVRQEGKLGTIAPGAFADLLEHFEVRQAVKHFGLQKSNLWGPTS